MALRIAFLSTYPPTQCGLATFTRSQVEQLVGRRDVEVGVVSLVDRAIPDPPAPVVHQLESPIPGATRQAAALLNTFDAVIVQHEYGIFGGRDGADVLDVLQRLRVPVITILHTVLSEPSSHQHHVLDGVVRQSSALITMTETARERLLARWPSAAPEEVLVVPHGAHPNEAAPDDPASGPRRTILTWGLLGPGKGIEWAIEALAELGELPEPPRYLIVGQTHPRVLEREGEAYRDRLRARAEELGVRHLVAFDATYHDGDELRRIVRGADVVLLPYDSREQVTSGVLTEAVVAGKPVISTAFPHARELLGDGTGLLVPQGDPHAMAHALRRVLTEPDLMAAMGERARAIAPTLHWSAVTDRLVELARELHSARVRSVA
jgi:glycosyltransferase involved in cell wall biosynthesis